MFSGVLLVAAFAISIRWHVNVGFSPRQNACIGIGLGAITYHQASFSLRYARMGVNIDDVTLDQKLTWVPRWYVGSGMTQVVVPIWMPLALLAVTAAFTLVADSHFRGAGLCTRCGYSLVGNTSGKCPECGCAVKDGGHGASESDP